MTVWCVYLAIDVINNVVVQRTGFRLTTKLSIACLPGLQRASHLFCHLKLTMKGESIDHR
jgi:hypothetical protein